MNRLSLLKTLAPIVAKDCDRQERASSERAAVLNSILATVLKDTFERLGVKLNKDASISIDPYFETSREGILAVGDVHGDIKLMTVAWAESIQAAIHAFKEITSRYWLSEKRLRHNKIGKKIPKAARAPKRFA
jgi:thioredoxin reductase